MSSKQLSRQRRWTWVLWCFTPTGRVPLMHAWARSERGRGLHFCRHAGSSMLGSGAEVSTGTGMVGVCTLLSAFALP